MGGMRLACPPLSNLGYKMKSESLYIATATIILFSGYHSADTAAWIWNIAYISWYQMDMDMRNTLTSSLTNIDSNIISVRMESFVHQLFAMVDSLPEMPLLFWFQVKIKCNMTFGND